MNNGIRRSEVDGVQASWRLDHHRIVIVSVDTATGGHPPVALAPGDRPDLVQARERWPQLTRLWDAVRHDFWSGPRL
jgi:hypothetical protein